MDEIDIASYLSTLNTNNKIIYNLNCAYFQSLDEYFMLIEI